MSDQSTTASVTGSATDTQAAPAKDILDRLTDIESRLSALESKPAPVADGFTDSHLAALKRAIKTIFGDDIE